MADVVNFPLSAAEVIKHRIRVFDQLADLIVMMDMSKDLREKSHTNQNRSSHHKNDGTAKPHSVSFLLIPFSLTIDILQSSFSETRAVDGPPSPADGVSILQHIT
ncbi:TPA: hypothetical protein L9M76_005259 [Klebsiella variicola]|uniref:hypothetical protein n=1 Tax=Klebsiella variicola TaxID=244366 RepID=UPI0039724ADF|nr:hypothetical protein [Klebsiella variicola]HBR2065171.1 hypothetical protein [Klebsiella variicola]HCI4584765.1 hypothetical protein [Klebsiella variicola subsp. variicola]